MQLPRGRRVIPADTAALVDAQRNQGEIVRARAVIAAAIAARDTAIVALIHDGWAIAVIARQIGVTTNTVQLVQSRWIASTARRSSGAHNGAAR